MFPWPGEVDWPGRRADQKRARRQSTLIQSGGPGSTRSDSGPDFLLRDGKGPASIKRAKEGDGPHARDRRVSFYPRGNMCALRQKNIVTVLPDMFIGPRANNGRPYKVACSPPGGKNGRKNRKGGVGGGGGNGGPSGSFFSVTTEFRLSVRPASLAGTAISGGFSKAARVRVRGRGWRFGCANKHASFFSSDEPDRRARGVGARRGRCSISSAGVGEAGGFGRVSCWSSHNPENDGLSRFRRTGNHGAYGRDRAKKTRALNEGKRSATSGGQGDRPGRNPPNLRGGAGGPGRGGGGRRAVEAKRARPTRRSRAAAAARSGVGNRRASGRRLGRGWGEAFKRGRGDVGRRAR